MILFNILQEGGPPTSNPDKRSIEPGVGSGQYTRQKVTADEAFEPYLRVHGWRLHAEGILGETLAKRALENAGYQVTSTNLKDPLYPVDLLALDPKTNTGMLIEVKATDINSVNKAWRSQPGGAQLRNRLAVSDPDMHKSEVWKELQQETDKRKMTALTKTQGEFPEFKIAPTTLGMQLDFKNNSATFYKIPYFKSRIPWSSADAHYYGSAKFSDADMKLAADQTLNRFARTRESQQDLDEIRAMYDEWISQWQEAFDQMLAEMHYKVDILGESKKKKKKKRIPMFNHLGGIHRIRGEVRIGSSELSNIVNHF